MLVNIPKELIDG
jgi:hypothetical protein